jgi:hypothetical protein
MLAELLSSPTKLVRFFRQSRDAWKARSHKNQRRVKALDGKVRDLQRSRERWKTAAKQYRQELKALQNGTAKYGVAPAATEGTAHHASAAGGTLIVAPAPLGVVASAGRAESSSLAAPAAPPFCRRSFMASR